MAKVYEIDPRKARALELLLAGTTTRAACLSIGVDRSTLYRWRMSPEWQIALSTRSSERLDDVRAELESAAVAASEYIRAVAEGAAADQGRLAACRIVLERAVPPTHVDPSGREAAHKALQAAMGGEEAVVRHIGEAVTAAWGFAPVTKVGA